jgi:hypothetical protein
MADDPSRVRVDWSRSRTISNVFLEVKPYYLGSGSGFSQSIALPVSIAFVVGHANDGGLSLALTTAGSQIWFHPLTSSSKLSFQTLRDREFQHIDNISIRLFLYLILQQNITFVISTSCSAIFTI